MIVFQIYLASALHKVQISNQFNLLKVLCRQKRSCAGSRQKGPVQAVGKKVLCSQ